jgi:hypothetical protein
MRMLPSLPCPLLDSVSSFLDVDDVFHLALSCRHLRNVLLEDDSDQKPAPIWTRLLQRELPFALQTPGRRGFITRQQFMQHFGSLDSWEDPGHELHEALSVELPIGCDSVAQLGLDCVVAYESSSRGWWTNCDDEAMPPPALDLVVVRPSTGEVFTSRLLHDAYHEAQKAREEEEEVPPPCFVSIAQGVIAVFNFRSVTEYSIRCKDLLSTDIELEFVRSSELDMVPSPQSRSDLRPILNEWNANHGEGWYSRDSQVHYGHEFELVTDFHKFGDYNHLTVTRGNAATTTMDMEISHCNHGMYAIDGSYALCPDGANEDAAYSFQIVDYRWGDQVRRGMRMGIRSIECKWPTLWLGSLSMLITVETSSRNYYAAEEDHRGECRLVGVTARLPENNVDDIQMEDAVSGRKIA